MADLIRSPRDNFKLVRVSVVCRKGLAEMASEAMLDASNNLSVYGMEIMRRDLSEEEWREVVRMVPADILKEDDPG